MNDQPEFRRRTISALRNLCQWWGVLPASYTLQGEAIVPEEYEMAAGGYSEVWRGTRGLEKVAIKVIKTKGTLRWTLKKVCAVITP